MGLPGFVRLSWYEQHVDGDECGAWCWQGEREYWERNMSQYHFVHHKSHMDRLGIEPGLRGENLATD